MVTVLKESPKSEQDVILFYNKLEMMHNYIGRQMNQIKKSDFPDMTMKATIDKIEDYYGDLQGILVNYNK